MNEVSVYRIEYTLGESSWIACIAAYKGEEALSCLKSRLASPPIIVAIAKECRLDGFSAAVRDELISEAYGVDGVVEVAPEVIEEVPEPEPDTRNPFVKAIVKMRKKKPHR